MKRGRVLAALVLALMLGAVVAAVLSERRIKGSVPGEGAVLSLAVLPGIRLVGTAEGMYVSKGGQARWAAVPGFSEGTALASSCNDEAVMWRESGFPSLVITRDVVTLERLGARTGRVVAIGAACSGRAFVAEGSGQISVWPGARAAGESSGPREVVAMTVGGGRLLAGGLTSGLWELALGSKSWRKLVATPTTALLVDPTEGRRWYLGTPGGLLVSENAGLSFSFTALRDPIAGLAAGSDGRFAVTAGRLIRSF